MPTNTPLSPDWAMLSEHPQLQQFYHSLYENDGKITNAELADAIGNHTYSIHTPQKFAHAFEEASNPETGDKIQQAAVVLDLLETNGASCGEAADFMALSTEVLKDLGIFPDNVIHAGMALNEGSKAVWRRYTVAQGYLADFSDPTNLTLNTDRAHVFLVTPEGILDPTPRNTPTDELTKQYLDQASRPIEQQKDSSTNDGPDYALIFLSIITGVAFSWPQMRKFARKMREREDLFQMAETCVPHLIDLKTLSWIYQSISWQQYGNHKSQKQPDFHWKVPFSSVEEGIQTIEELIQFRTHRWKDLAEMYSALSENAQTWDYEPLALQYYDEEKEIQEQMKKGIQVLFAYFWIKKRLHRK
jgi:hypothetical protein